MKLNDRVSLVGSGDLAGVSITHPLDCHVYLLDCEDEYALIDAGGGQDISAIISTIEEDGFDLGKVRYLLLTHTHFDHAGGARGIRDALNLQVVASELSARILETGDETAISLDRAKIAGFYPEEVKFISCPVDVITNRDTILEIGCTKISVISTPGHSNDHISYLTSEDNPILFGGDSVFVGGKIILQNIPDCNLQEYIKTIDELSNYNVTSLLPGHGLFAMKRGDQHIQLAKSQLEQLIIPPNLPIP
jgi:glyoxylase-like metal-dependent hydrolase (beta-lactamase superfamily II)